MFTHSSLTDTSNACRIKTYKLTFGSGCTVTRLMYAPPFGFIASCELIVAPSLFCVQPFGGVRLPGISELVSYRLLWPLLSCSASALRSPLRSGSVWLINQVTLIGALTIRLDLLSVLNANSRTAHAFTVALNAKSERMRADIIVLTLRIAGFSFGRQSGVPNRC